MDRTALDYDAIRHRLEGQAGRHYWRSLEQLADDPAFAAFVEAEFPGVAPQMDRRRFLQLMGASMAMAGLAGCGPPPEKGVPYVEQPEQTVPGQARWYATAVPFAGYAQPVLGRTQVGRPTKLEGNPEHPLSGGACDAFTQAAILQLYDPDRSQAPRHMGRASSWDAFERVAFECRAELDGNGGRGLHVLLGASSSPTLRRQLGELLERWPEARLYRHEAFEGQAYAAAEQAFGRPLETHYRLEHAELVLSLDDDWLGPGPKQTGHVRAWAERKRRAARGEGEARLLVLEAVLSGTGAKASERRRVAPSALVGQLQALAAALGEGDAAPALAEEQQRWIDAVARALRARPGRCLITAGPRTPLAVQAAVHRLNQRLGNVGRTVFYSEPVQWLSVAGQRLGELPVLVEAIDRGEVQTLLMLDCNPAYSAPGSPAFAEALERVPLRIHAGLYYDESAARSHWHLAMSHALDGWSDARAADGSLCLIQPLVRPLYAARSLGEILALLLGDSSATALSLVRGTWREWSDERWREALSLGFVPDSALPPVTPQAAPLRLDGAPVVAGLELQIGPDPCIWDGRFANLGWLQELPKPISKLTWDNVIGLSPALGERYGIANGDRLRVSLGDAQVEGPAWLMPGQADEVLSLYGGYGRSRAGRVGDGIGYDPAPLRSAEQPWLRRGARLVRLDQYQPLASTQAQHLLAGRELIRRLPRDEAFADVPVQAEAATLYPPVPLRETSWGMTIDLDQCIGCNACVVACQAENNIPVVGREQVAQGRAMHWLRVDHYYSGDLAEPQSSFQPVPCMHCEQAPCEVGCPVNATVHGPDGLNEMVYNRCIGTRTCSTYCPYKVRRFNWTDLTGDDPPAIQAQRNPNVTVRSRGVMEKCTYCVQRISEARIAARIDGREIADGEVKTACQQTCPSQAIVFGNLSDPAAEVNRERHTARHYRLLEELNTRPKTTYLGQVEDVRVEEDEA